MKQASKIEALGDKQAELARLVERMSHSIDAVSTSVQQLKQNQEAFEENYSSQ